MGPPVPSWLQPLQDTQPLAASCSDVLGSSGLESGQVSRECPRNWCPGQGTTEASPQRPTMWARPSVSPGCVPQPCVLSMLGILLLLTSLSAHNTSWDNPFCTEGVVSVSRGRQAVMACNISNAFSHITVRLRTHGKDWTIFSEKAPGRFSRAGWQLQVQGGQAQLVIAAAQDAHAGLYLWRLQGLQRNYKVTSLNVSAEPQDLDEAAGLGPSRPPWDAASQVLGSETLQARSQATPQSMVGVLVAVLLLILVVGALGWC
ncbi:secreted and transmembrane protein 1A-like isoform X2 [Sciurus carolinensis]|uniref:secreted and transmembrane protein 1A-like isoform X2 n=1 Tax=Sciurus carolinensis TaxID=30640 RepID=UPI001FB300C5|nr:secreted and transmembrane protein 1A-like isoform X2 [Sciurus carolinensis]